MDILKNLREGYSPSNEELYNLLKDNSKETNKALQELAFEICEKYYEDKIFIRGLIEYSNYCKENCLYCGIQKSNLQVERFRLKASEVLDSARNGYRLGFRTFVLQGGEDPGLKDDYFLEIIKSIKESYPDTRITLSIGKRSYESLKKMKEAGADRFLLRHEAASDRCFSSLHPSSQLKEDRFRVLKDLKDLGYITGSGFMVGAPFQGVEDIIEDIRFLEKLRPEMIGIGPFIPQEDTVFKTYPHGDLNLTLRILSILRIMFPKSLIPATTALNTISEEGRILGILHGCNVVMPNISPEFARENYKLYDKKKTTNLEAGEYIGNLGIELNKIGKKIVIDRGDPIGEKND